MTKIMGHRGAAGCEPENTLRGFRLALSLGVAAVELDVHLTKDGRLAVIHDDTVDRTTNGAGRVKDLTLAELHRLDAGLGEYIPSLDEVVDLVKARAYLVVELKQPDAALPLLQFFEARDLFGHACVISFWHPAIKALKERQPRLKTGALMVGCPVDPAGLARAALADTLVLNYKYVDRELVERAHLSGLKVFIWNIDSTEELKSYLTMNLDGIGTNRPDLVMEYLRGRPGT